MELQYSFSVILYVYNQLIKYEEWNWVARMIKNTIQSGHVTYFYCSQEKNDILHLVICSSTSEASGLLLRGTNDKVAVSTVLPFHA